ncbi:carboxypeptidase N subunit 2-like [Cydia pomonella]|uniref:carboxypeptidase N subunit 2-like n=1 Tax=Cydia pomonella TaxID=82600 RepID=UPI002ADE934E|nr:carboxypeptidase N subunit 2-like [Cydia pomonella]
MMELKVATCFALFLCIFKTVHAEPNCSNGFGATGPNVICIAGAEDYVLRKGLVSDNDLTTAIVLKGCRITSIEEGALGALPALEDIDLSQNSLQALTRMLDKTPNLLKLNLSNNRIESLQLNIFDALTKLKSLDLSNNVILGRNIQSRVFEELHHIEFLDLSGNFMTGTPENLLQALQSIKTLKLSRCNLDEVPKFATHPNLNSMTRLTLSANLITALHNKLFINSEKLESIEFDDNLIEFIQEDVFKSLKNIKTISLQHNKIKDLPESLFKSLPKLGNINLSHNLIEYIPANAFRHTGLKNLNLADNKFTYLQDNFCLELRNSGVRLKKFYFNQNPWQCACLNDILIEVKKMGIHYNGAKYIGQEPVCVTTKEFNCQRQPNYNEEYKDLYNDIIG